MRTVESPPLKERPLDISYRGSIQPLSFGRLGFEKRKIGYDVARAAAKYPIAVDISSRKGDRIGGTDWFDFLGRSRAVLGVESGANLFDFTGEVEIVVLCVEETHPKRTVRPRHFTMTPTRPTSTNSKATSNTPKSRRAISKRLPHDHYRSSTKANIQGAGCGPYFVPLRRDMENFDRFLIFCLMTGGCRRWSSGPMRKSS